MINYTEKTIHMHNHIVANGHSLQQVDGVWVSSDDVAVQALIDAYNPLEDIKAEKKQLLKKEAGRRAGVIYGFIDDSRDAQAFYNFASDIYLSIVPAARGALVTRLAAFKDIKDTATTAIAAVDAETDWQTLYAYDVNTDPGW